MENLTPVYKDAIPDKLDFCDCCSSYRNKEEVFKYEGCYKFCLDCAINNKLNVVNGMAATFGEEPIDFKGINKFITGKIKTFNRFV